MPFQVVFSASSQGAGTIQSFTAGKDQAAICASFHTVDATVVGDLTGHNIEWEQLSGSPVTFLSSVNELSVYFSTDDFSDRAFRFWIDKGTANEQYDDVNVYGSPTEQINTDITPGVVTKSSSVNYGLDVGSNETILRVVVDFPLNQTYVRAAGYVEHTDMILTWTVSGNTDAVIGFTLQHRVDGVWVDIIELNASARSYPITSIDVVRVITKYDASMIRMTTTSNVKVTAGQNRDTEVISVADTVFQPNITKKGVQTSDHQVSLRFKTVIDAVETGNAVDVTSGILFKSVITQDYVVFAPIVVRLDAAETDAGSNTGSVPSVTPGVMRLSRTTIDYTVIDLSGEQIGG